MRSPDFITRAIRRTMLALGCAFALGACTTWVPTPTPTPTPAPAALREFTGPVHVIRHGTFSLVLRDAYVKGDTLYGYSARTLMAVALRDVKAIRREKIQPLRTIGALALAAVLALGVAVVVIIHFEGYT